MINYDYTVTVTGNTAKLDKDIYLFRGNKNVHYYFAVKNASFNFKGSTDLIEKTNAINAAVTVIKPNGVEVANAIAEVENGKIHLKVTEDLIDEEAEVGDFDLVFDLFDDTDGAVTIPKVQGQFHVLERPCTTPISELVVTTNTTNEVDKAITDYAIATYAEPVTSTTDDGTFAKKTWVAKEKITTAELNRMEEGIYNNSSQYKDIANKIESGNIGNNVEPLDDDLPNVYITGTLPTSKGQGDLPITIHYISKTLDFKNYGTLKVQGASSAGYPKKNFTLKLYEDKALTTKAKRAFKTWSELNKFVLKAHWIDHSHVRNVGTAKIWGKIVKSRSDYETLPTELKNSPNLGATDGFTVRVFANGIYQGLYEWIVPKDAIFGQSKKNANHSIATTELNNQASCAFATTTPTISGNWSEELQDTMSTAISTSLTNFIKFVAGSTDADFIANAENYFDVQSVIDYDIFARIFCIVDNLCRNQIFFTYDGTKWYEGVWDLDGVLGLPPTTRGFFSYDTEFQSGYIAYKDYKVTNILYQRVENLFTDRFKARYNELRSDILSIENIIEVYERLTNIIKTYDGLLEEDYASTTGDGNFIDIPYKSENNIQQIRNYIAKRLPYMDGIVQSIESGGSEESPVACTEITLDKTELTFTDENTQTLTPTVTPIDTTDSILWSVSPTGICIVSNGNITPVTNGTCTVTATCGSKSATCSVTISGIEVNLLTNTNYSKGYLNVNTGELVSTSSDIATDFIELPDDINKFLLYDKTNMSPLTSTRIHFYDVNKNYLGYKIGEILLGYGYYYTIEFDKSDEDYDLNTKYVRICSNRGSMNAFYFGKFKDIPCTEITLDKTELTFTDENTQTLTPTILPKITTDKFTWGVNPIGIVNIKNTNITPVTNGTCTVTATCGSKSATCSVTISGIDSHIVNSFEDALVYEGYFGDEGSLKTELNMHHTSYIPIISGTINDSIANEYLRISYFDESLNYLGYDRGLGLNVRPSSNVNKIVLLTNIGASYFVINLNNTSIDSITISS